MNAHEHLVAEQLCGDGWRVLHRGAPDFLLVRGREVAFCEVKHGTDELTPEQREWRRALRSLGAPFRVARTGRRVKTAPRSVVRRLADDPEGALSPKVGVEAERLGVPKKSLVHQILHEELRRMGAKP